MKTYYVEVYSPAYPQSGRHFRVHRDCEYCADILNSGCIAVFQVEGIQSKNEAVAAVLSTARGGIVSVRKIV